MIVSVHKIFEKSDLRLNLIILSSACQCWHYQQLWYDRFEFPGECRWLEQLSCFCHIICHPLQFKCCSVSVKLVIRLKPSPADKKFHDLKRRFSYKWGLLNVYYLYQIFVYTSETSTCVQVSRWPHCPLACFKMTMDPQL